MPATSSTATTVSAAAAAMRVSATARGPTIARMFFTRWGKEPVDERMTARNLKLAVDPK